MRQEYKPYLAHHGILGQKWGIRRFQNKDGSYTSAGKKRKNLDKSKKENDTEDKKKGLSRNQKIAIAATGVALTAIGGYYLYKTGKLDGLIDAGKNVVEKQKSPGDAGSGSILKDITTGFSKLANNSMSSIERAKLMNPLHRQDNCKECSFAYAMSKIHGIDVFAGQKSVNGNLRDFVEKYCEGDADNLVKEISGDGSNIQERLEKRLLKVCKEGDVGAVAFDFDPKYLRQGSKERGHAFNFEIVNGIVQYIDSQGNEDGVLKENPSDFFKYKDPNTLLQFVNYSNCTIKQSVIGEAIKDGVMRK